MAMMAAGTPRLVGRVAVVTGAGGVIGRATCVRLAADGAAGGAGDFSGGGRGGTGSLVRASGGAALAVTVDVSDERSVAALVAATVHRFGRLDVLHNNAALMSTELPD